MRAPVDLRPGELRPALGALSLLIVVMFGHVMLETARDALFLSKLPASRLAVVYALVAVLALLVSGVNARLVRRIGEGRALLATLLFASSGTLVLYFQPATRAVVFLVYVWSALLGTLLVVQFWMLVCQVFTQSQGKRIFGLIGAGGVVGAIAGTGSAFAVLAVVPVRGLLLGAAGAFALAAAIATTIRPGAEERVAAQADTSTPLPPPLFRHPYVAWLAVLTALSTATVLATDYVFKADVASRVAPDRLGPYFARSYVAFNGAALIVQVLVSGPLVRRVGVTRAIMVVPLLLLAGGVAIVLSGTHAAVLLTKGVDGALRHSLHRHTSELLSQPLPASSRARAKPVIDGALARATQAAMGGAIFLLAAAGLGSPRVLAGVVAALALLWLGAAVAVRRPYLDVFRRALADDAHAGGGAESEREWTRAALASLGSPSESRVVEALGLLAEAHADLVPSDVLRHQSEVVRLRALELMASAARADWAPDAKQILREGETERLRVAAVRALAAVGRWDAVEEALRDRAPAVRAHAAVAITRAKQAGDGLSAPLLRELLDVTGDERRTVRLAVLSALEGGADHRFSELIVALADPADPEMMRHATRAMAAVRDPRFIPALVAHLHVRADRTLVRDALVALGAPAQEELERALRSEDTLDRVRLHIPRTIARFENQRAADFLAEQLAVEDDRLIRYKLLRGLGALVARAPVRVDRASILGQVRQSLIEYLEVLTREVALETDPDAAAGESGQLLVGLLRDKLEQALERVFRLLQIAYRREDIRSAYAAIRSADRRVRSNGVEFLDALTSDARRGLASDLRELLELVVDDLPSRAKAERAKAKVSDSPEDFEAALLLLVRDQDAAVAALAVHLALRHGNARARAAAEQACCDRPWLVLADDGTPMEGAMNAAS